ncbi:MAG: hypothetical protein U1E53_10040 [Dongiaceae bacterium]
MQERSDRTTVFSVWSGRPIAEETLGTASRQGVTTRPAARLRLVGGRDLAGAGRPAARPFGAEERARLARLAARLRIAGVGTPADGHNAALPAGYAYLAQFVANDLPGAAAALPPAPAQRADARTVAEIGALLQRFHSVVRDAVVAGCATGRGRRFARQADLAAATALANRAYRRIVIEDLLSRLLDPALHRGHRGAARGSGRQPCAAEAASVAGWLGTALAQRPEAPAGVVGRIGRIDWSRLFELGPEAPEPSRLLLPVIAGSGEGRLPSQWSTEDSPLYREMVRAGAGMRPVGTLIEALGLDGPDQPRLLAQPAYRRAVLAEWLALPGGLGIPAYRLTDEDVAALSEDPPLPFFLLFEAMVLGQGRRLGPLGSVLLSEALAAPLARTLDGPADPGLERQVFPGGMPDCMPALIRWVEG